MDSDSTARNQEQNWIIECNHQDIQHRPGTQSKEAHMHHAFAIRKENTQTYLQVQAFSLPRAVAFKIERNAARFPRASFISGHLCQRCTERGVQVALVVRHGGGHFAWLKRVAGIRERQGQTRGQ